MRGTSYRQPCDREFTARAILREATHVAVLFVSFSVQFVYNPHSTGSPAFSTQLVYNAAAGQCPGTHVDSTTRPTSTCILGQIRMTPKMGNSKKRLRLVSSPSIATRVSRRMRFRFTARDPLAAVAEAESEFMQRTSFITATLPPNSTFAATTAHDWGGLLPCDLLSEPPTTGQLLAGHLRTPIAVPSCADPATPSWKIGVDDNLRALPEMLTRTASTAIHTGSR